MGVGGLIQGITGRDLPWRGGLLTGEERRGGDKVWTEMKGKMEGSKIRGGRKK